MIEPFAVTARNDSGALALELRGDVDGQGLEPLLAAYAKATATLQVSEVILDFSNVGYINSSGIALIVSLLGRARADHRRVAAVGLSEHYRQIFEITRLSDFIEIRDDSGRPADAPRRSPSTASG
ncbi:MAG: STAS domain-containing protein [Candidatus Dormibacteria bacterium]